MIPSVLPTINATLNGLAGIFLLLGWRAIRRKEKLQHQRFMIAALICSALFLCSYLTYHLLIHGGVTRYHGAGLSRWIYFFILLTHTPLAAVIVPFIIAAVWLAVQNNFAAHMKITRWLLPVWLYVSVTGVLIYFMLYVWR
jgi:putative membrane protein